MTRDEQLAAAERIAALNPDWPWDGLCLWMRREDDKATVMYSSIFNDWTALGRPDVGRHHNPASCIRALGYSIKESPDE